MRALSVRRCRVLFFIFNLACALPLYAQEPQADPPANFLFRDQFYLKPSLKVRHNTFQAEGLLVVERPNRELNSNIAAVTGFAPQALRTRALKDIQTVDQAKEWIRAHKKTSSFQGVPIHELSVPIAEGVTDEIYWVGNRGFDSYEDAAAEIAMVQSLVELQGGDFNRALELAEKFRAAEEKIPTPEETARIRAQFEKEEEIALRLADQLDIGEALFGPFQGVPTGEPLLFQSFGESSWRSTNLAERNFRSIVAFWTNRMVFKGVRFPLSTIDVYGEVVVAPETSQNDGGNQLDLTAGLEWRPLARNVWLENFRPWGLPLLRFARNYRFYVQYMNRRNLKDEIANIRDYDLRAGVDIFYEWGIDLDPIDQEPGKGVPGFLSDYTWGEYFGNYNWRDTNFTAEENFDAFVLDNSVVLGLKVPLLNLPPNPVNDQLIAMPYVRFAMISNTRLSNRADNRYYASVGIRWMPFRDYRFINNEWLFKTKFFAEYLAIGKVRNLKYDDVRPEPDEDWRIGLAWSLRRF